ncbi:hypothetical protein E3N88_35016 [Mikania micrantha]|uniref:Uncharacterized protein n=1 Tax=Mikania micrantha TaxID=192012 RepID=A0A5N6M0P5_9ASTR|nr:hypothetical protein E3N88_35016 [Mikania micrantha]
MVSIVPPSSSFVAIFVFMIIARSSRRQKSCVLQIKSDLRLQRMDVLSEYPSAACTVDPPASNRWCDVFIGGGMAFLSTWGFFFRC